jgi:hypothetical protein
MENNKVIKPEPVTKVIKPEPVTNQPNQPTQHEVAEQLQEQEVAVDPASSAHSEAIIVALGELAVVGKKVWKDKKFDVNDTVHILPAIQKVPTYLEAASNYKKAWEELKNFNVAKAVKLVQVVDAQVKAFEKA